MLEVALLNQIFAGKLKPAYQKEVQNEVDDIEVHQKGLVPIKLINDARPHESSEIKKYRVKIYKPKTKNIFNRVVSSLSKIERATDFSVKFDSSGFPESINEEEAPDDFNLEYYPIYNSVTDYVFRVGINTYVKDPNAVLAVCVNEDTINVPDNEFIKPYPKIFPFKNVLAFAKDCSYFVCEDETKCNYITPSGNIAKGRIVWVFDKQNIQRYEQINSDGALVLKFDYLHGFDYCPAIQLKGAVVDEKDGYIIYSSRLSPMVSDLDEAAREYNDLQASKIMHLYPERWEFANLQCKKCSGSGFTTKVGMVGIMGSTKETCSECQGHGSAGRSPLQKIIVNPADLQLGQAQAPIPPAGFIEKDVEILKMLETSVETHIYNALASVHMQHLAQVPMQQSGVAKAIDRDEQNNFIYSVQTDLANLIYHIIYCNNKYRYSYLMQNASKEDFEKLMPQITLSQKFDLISSEYLMNELVAATEKVGNAALSNQLQVEYANKKFYNEPSAKELVQLTIELDPLPNKTSDEKMVELQTDGITKEDYIISCNIYPFVKRALIEDENFCKLGYMQQMEVLTKYATEKIVKQPTNIIKTAPIN